MLDNKKTILIALICGVVSTLSLRMTELAFGPDQETKQLQKEKLKLEIEKLQLEHQLEEREMELDTTQIVELPGPVTDTLIINSRYEWTQL